MLRGELYNTFITFKNNLITSDEVLGCLSKNQIDILAKRFSKLVSNYSVRTKTVLTKIGFEDFVKKYLFDDLTNLLKIRNFGKRSLKEVIDFREKLLIEFNKVSLLPEDCFEVEKYISEIGEYFRDDFVFDFYKNQNHLPMFWLLERYFNNKNSKELDIFTSSFKIFQNQQILKRKEIAKKHNLTIERVRQIRNKVLYRHFQLSIPEIKDLIQIKDKNNLKKYVALLQNKENWIYCLELLKKDAYFAKQAPPDILNYLKTENCNFSTEFALQTIAYLFSDVFVLFGGFVMFKEDRVWKSTFLIRKEFTDLFDFEKMKEEFGNVLMDKTHNYLIDIDKYVANSQCWKKFDVDKIDKITKIVKDIVLCEFGLHSEDVDGLIKIPKSKRRIALDALYEVLLTKGSPMHLEDIFIEFKKILPNHKYTKASQLRPYLQGHEAISYRNRKSVYTLKEWKHIRTGTIRDAIMDFLSENDLPQTRGNIAKYVLQHFPETNLESVRASMSNDTQKRFSCFKNNLFGLKNKEYPAEYEEIIK